jgi:hypothetical protein
MGKMLLAVGEAALRSVEAVILYRRRTFKSFFPHKDLDQLGVDEDNMYSDLLELTR